MKPIVYIETSIVSYLTARQSRDLIAVAHQQLTLEWWEKVRPQVDCVISGFVVQEASRGDPNAAQKRLEILTQLRVLELNEEIRTLASQYFATLQIPESSKTDAFHMAVAVWHKTDYILTWNCRHIANGRVRKILEELNFKLHVKTPVICTPEELMEV
jgi:hypothetical protein